VAARLWIAETCHRFLFLRSGNPRGTNPRIDATWANTRATSSYANAYAYTGRQLDAETGRYDYRARVCAPQLGRFCSRDPIGYGGGIDLFEFVLGSPTVLRDPSGMGIDYLPLPIAEVPGDIGPEPKRCSRMEFKLVGRQSCPPDWEFERFKNDDGNWESYCVKCGGDCSHLKPRPGPL
jgi:RHS repeat-associated protein